MFSKLLWTFLKVSAVTALLQSSGGFGQRYRVSLQMSKSSVDRQISSWSASNPQDCKDAKDKLNIWPLDDYNARLLNEVRPKSWKHANPDVIYDFIAIGAGAGGLVSSRQVARRGGKSAMISSHLAGGDCLNVGCVPSKALIRCARMIREVRKAKSESEFGVRINGDVEVDFGAIMERMRKLRAEIAPIDGHERGQSIGADVYQGLGRFVDENTIEIIPSLDEKPIQLRFRKVAICTGGRASIPSGIPGLMDAPFTTNENLFNLTRLPPRMVILGSGVVALEMAQVFATFGTEVTVLVRSNSLFPRVDPEVGSCLKRCLEE
jgi:Pyruvate/2-oxoglutarate dehydrogenase complex, dihydrolipoamide dehydrogenase (E3) component, and related enzymes